MDGIIHTKTNDARDEHRHRHEGYEFYRRDLVPERDGGQCEVALYEIPPKMAAFPYHYHLKNEESYYIIKGEGILKTPEGERTVVAGDFLFFPANEQGAHKLTNASDTEPLVYIDFDTLNDLEVAVYPDSGKLGIWGKGVNKLYRQGDNVAYYEGE